MVKNRINTTSVREIKSSFKRFISLLVMSMLGVAVFVGLRMASQDMIKSLDTYYDNSKFYDIKVISTLGLTNDDIREIENIKGVKKVYGSYSKDVLIKTSDTESVIKVIGLTDNVNKVEITTGRIPKNKSEIVVEEKMLYGENLKVGNEITLLDEETFNETKLTIVGTVKSPLYISNTTTNSSRGNTNLGTGKINYYTYVNETNFNLDYYTEIYVTIDNAINEITNNHEYNKLVNNCLEEIDKIKEDREKARYNEIYNTINEEIIKNETEGYKKLNSAKLALDNAYKELQSGKVTLDSSKMKLEIASITLNDTKDKLDYAKEKLENNKLLLDEAKTKIDESKELINNELSIYGITLDDINNFLEYINNIDVSKDTIIDAIPTDTLYYQDIVDAINKIYELNLEEELKDFVNNSITKEDLINKIPMDSPYYNEIVDAINKISDIDIKSYITSDENIDKIIGNIPTDMPYYSEIISVLELYKENNGKVIEAIDAIKQIKTAEEEYNKGLLLYNNALEEYNLGYNAYTNYYNGYQNGLSSYNNGLKEYNTNLNLYNTKIEEYYNSKKIFELEIQDAKKKLDEIPEANWYVYERLDDSSYSGFINDTESLTNLSKVFPTIFFVVAILISLISMSRMVEDDRMLIGTLKSLGFNNKDIRKKYLLYSGIATLLGGLIGAAFGFFILAYYVWTIYKILYDIPVFSYDFDLINAIIGILIALICICGTTLLTIRKVVKEKPSELMRPKAPEVGKRVLLEKMPFIWNKLSFSNKITVRNLFRYKKRVLTTIVGILGCTGLILAGFGIRDSIVGIPDKQFKEVFTFDEMVYLTSDLKDNQIDEIFNNEHIKTRVDTYMNASMTSDNNSINIFVPDDEDNFKKIVDLKDVEIGEELQIQNNKVIISDKLAQLTNKEVGDRIVLKSSDNKEYEFIISAVCENYVGNYVYMNKETYENNIGKYSTNVVYLKIDDIKNEDKLSKELLENENVMTVTSIELTAKGINNMLQSLNSIVLILIVLSGNLSFVVLYNLSYINVSERKREIATLKVLGFTDKEVDNYITKEIIILTVIGIALGLGFGIFLTNVIITTVEIDMVRFLNKINLSSFIITTILVLSFTFIVNKIIHYTLKKIDMIESLKSVE